jgi:signal recognition particle receptor subunit beta
VKLHEALEAGPGNTGKLVQLQTSLDRTLFFDFLPSEPIIVKGFKGRFQFYAVTGPVAYNASRELVLRGVDGVVFVADSQNERMSTNVESFENLQYNLRRLTLDLDDIACVLQYNKRDLPNVAALERMEAVLNNRGVKVPSFPGIATNGTGVLESINQVKQMLLYKVR